MITHKGYGKAFAVIERHAAQNRMHTLTQRLADIDPLADDAEETRIEVKLALARVLDVVRTCDALLAPLPDNPVLPAIAATALDEPAARQDRLRLLIQAMTNLPPSCVEAGKVLRRALSAEMRGPSAGRVDKQQQRRRLT